MSKIAFPSIPETGGQVKQKLPPKKQKAAQSIVIPIPSLSQIQEQTQIPNLNLVPDDPQGSSPDHETPPVVHNQPERIYPSMPPSQTIVVPPTQTIVVPSTQTNQHANSMVFLNQDQMQSVFGYQNLITRIPFFETLRIMPIDNLSHVSQQNILHGNQYRSTAYLEPISVQNEIEFSLKNMKHSNISSETPNFQSYPKNISYTIKTSKNAKISPKTSEVDLMASKISQEMADPTKSFYLPSQETEPNRKNDFNIHKHGNIGSINIIGKGILPSIQFNVDNFQNT